jgi:hypothetical protein
LLVPHKKALYACLVVAQTTLTIANLLFKIERAMMTLVTREIQIDKIIPSKTLILFYKRVVAIEIQQFLKRQIS